MAIPISEGFLYTNPVPAQQWLRKLQSGVTYVDWSNTAEVDTFFATTTGLDPSYKLNKYFWIAGNLYQYTQAGYRLVGEDISDPGIKSMVFQVESDGNIIDTGLIDKVLVQVFIGSTTPPAASQVYDAVTVTMDSAGLLDGSLIGGFYTGNNVTILYKTIPI
jgi:hypothetical protein